MVNAKSSGTRDTPLKLASRISELANKEWKEGTFIEKVTSITRFENPLVIIDTKTAFNILIPVEDVAR